MITSKGENLEGTSIPGNTVEAIIGAIYLDSNYLKVKKVLNKILKANLLLLEENTDLKDPKSKLQEWSLKNKKKLPIYEIISKSGPDHSPIFSVKVILDKNCHSLAKGKSKQDAEIKAANKLLKKIRE